MSGAVEYFREHMAVGDYLTEDGKAEMTWFGAGADRLALQGRCQLEHFENLCHGLHPETGEKLMVRDKGAHRRVCFFGQISPPKDVSLLYLVGGDARIAGWWQEAVAETLHEIELTTATRVRRDGANEDRTTGNLIAAIVTHDASRALDPQLHTHLCLMNLTFDREEGRWKSVQPQAFFRHQGYFREVCYAALARRMTAAGYTLDSLRLLGFNVAGVPASLRDRFSKRRRKITEEAALRGITSQDGLQALTGSSRAAKSAITSVQLSDRWKHEAGAELADLHATIARASHRGKATRVITPDDALLSAEAHVFERRSVVQDRLLLREALIAGRGSVHVAELKRALAAREKTGELLRAEHEIASRAGLDAEQEFTGWANASKTSQALGKMPALVGMGDDQKKAIAGVLATRNSVVILQGDAGTGKTKCLQAVVAGIKQGGGQVFGCAPSSGATDVLRHELSADADTLQKLLASDTLQREVRGRVLIVDEASLISVREMQALCRLAARNDHRLILVGDIKQHYSVEAGDALRCLQEYARVPVFRLTEIRRQRAPAYRKAVARLAAGDALGAFNRFEKLGAVHEIPNGTAMLTAAAIDYVRTVRAGKSCLAISPVWSEIHDFNRTVRQQLRAAGLLAKQGKAVTTVHSLKWTREERRRLASYQPGDVLTFHRATDRFSKHDRLTVVRRETRELVVRDGLGREHRIDPRRTSGFDVGLAKETEIAVGDRLLLRGNLPAAALKNGDLAEISGFGPQGEVTLKDGRSIPDWFREFTHGYATTSHAAQGKTIDRGILIMGGDGITTGNLKQAYVSNSRFRESQGIYTTDRQGARNAMMRASDRKLSSELMPSHETVNRPWRKRWARRLAPLLKSLAA
ncbi:MobF family relaxase [Oleiharenicola lentus]|uniref:MobF family relaxase n=1 Tax=Oleiharenicola lentus TaxID=2508720 RepID=UPI003F6804C7